MRTNIVDSMELGGYSLKDLLEVYRSDLFQYYFPFLEKNVYDPEYGGFMCHVTGNGKEKSTHKRAWYDGRGVWIYCFLYQNFGKKEIYLEKATKTVEFLLSMESPEYPFWPWGYTRSGSKLKDSKPDIYGSLFIAEGLAGFAAATGEDRYWIRAKNILLKCVAEYDRDDYEYIPHYQMSDRSLPAPRVLGHWMIFLNLCGYLLEQQDDDDLKNISDRCIDALLEHHLHPESNLLIEYLQHDLSLPKSPLDQFAYTGHGIEVLWMLMAEAERRQNDELFDRAVVLFKRHVELSWDGVYGGFYHELSHVDENNWNLDKVLWAQEEVLIGLMMLIEKKKDEWAIRWFDKVYPHVRELFILHDHPEKLWINGGNRCITEHHHVDRFENYHHPRHLMMNILALERMVKKI